MVWCQVLFFQYGWLSELLSLSCILVEVRRLRTMKMLQIIRTKCIIQYLSLQFLFFLFQSLGLSLPDDRPVIPLDWVHSDHTLRNILFLTESAVRIHQASTAPTPPPLAEKERHQPKPSTPRTCLEHTGSTLPLAKSQLTAYT